MADDNEVALFDQRGEATAYIALNDELTIYLWRAEYLLLILIGKTVTISTFTGSTANTLVGLLAASFGATMEMPDAP